MFTRSIDRYHVEYSISDESFVIRRLDLPADSIVQEIFKGEAFVSLRSDWRGIPAGALVSVPLKGDAKPSLVYAPTDRSSFQSVTATRTQVLVSVLDNVVGKVLRVRKIAGAWTAEPLYVAPAGVSVDLLSVESTNDKVWLTESGFLVPDTILTGDAAEASPRFAPVRSAPAKFDASGFLVEQLEATSADGTQVPYFLVRPKEIARDGSTPTILHGYGGFEIAQTPFYLGAYGKIWLEKRGGAYVVANIRGGGEFGPKWHEAALREHHVRTFEDFEAVAADLARRGIASAARIGSMGGSNGGLTVGATYVRHPELFGAVVSQVPLLDMMRYNLLLAGPLWMSEYGDPNDPVQGAALRAYSPYQNARADVAYPPILFTTSTADDRVHPGHARKMTARLQEFGKDAMLWENSQGGHAGAADLEQAAESAALEFSFLWDRLSGTTAPKIK